MYVIVFQGNKNVRHANNLTVCTLQSDFVRYRWFYHRCLRTNNLKNDIIGWLKPTRCQRNVLLLTEMESLMEFFFCIISTEGRLANIMMVCKQKPWKKAEPHLHPKHQDGIFALNSNFFLLNIFACFKHTVNLWHWMWNREIESREGEWFALNLLQNS